ncbi:MAG: helix-turn-helix transcriptional regulator, partial [Nocardiopsaceae bacterium]|nr:helix-turn-helix transcriptional regulator [Nocardiopsaceae bacterium]
MPSGAGEPAGSPSLDAGTWLATLRVRQGLTRRELADRAQVPYPVLTTIEAAVELAPPAVLAACARALGVDPGLLARRYLPASADDMEVAAAERIRAGQDVLALPPAEAVRARPLPELAAELRQAASWTEAARFEAAAAVLPRLVTGLRLAVLTLTGEDKQTARRLLAEANRVGFLAFAGTAVARAAAGGGRELAASTPPPRGHTGPGGGRQPPGPGPLLPSRTALLGCGALGSLAGLGLARLYFSGSLPLLILGGCLGVAAAWFLHWLRAVYGAGDALTLQAGYGFLGFQSAILVWAVSAAHGVWVLVTVAWVLSWCMNAAGGRHPVGRAAMYGYLVIVTAILGYRLAYLHLS